MASLITAFIYKKKLKFDTTATGANVSSNQLNFPICVHINSLSWADATERTNFFNISNINGKRIQFFDADSTTNLSYEVEYYNSSTSEAIYWVKVPQVDGNSTADYIWVAFGNDPNSTNQDDATNVWDANYKAVWHLGDNSWGISPEVKDSTVVSIDGTNVGTTDRAGIVRQGRDFDGTNDYIAAEANAAQDITGVFTLSGMVYIDSLPGTGKNTNIATINEGGAPADIYDKTVRLFSTGILKGHVYDGASKDSPGKAITTGAWHYFAIYYDGSKIYANVDGVADAGTSAGASYNFTDPRLLLGAKVPSAADSAWFNGALDEIRISNTNRSTNWQKLEYYSLKKINFNGDSWLSWDAALTVISQPTVTTQAATSIIQSSATLNGNITSTGGENCTRRGFEVGITSGVYTITLYSDGDYGTGAFTSAYTGLWAGKTYYYRAYATNSQGTSYGTEQSFTTLSGLPFNEVNLSDDDTLQYNQCDIVIKNDNGDSEEISIRDDDYQLEQGPLVLTRKDSVIAKSSEAVAQAFINVQKYKDSMLRVKDLLIIPDSSPAALYPLVLGYDISTRITLQVNSTRNPANINQQYHIEGIEQEWDIRNGGQWQTRWQLWNVNKFRVFKLLHEGYLSNISEISYLDCLNASVASHIPFDDSGSIGVGQWETMAGAIFMSMRIERGLLEFDTTEYTSNMNAIGGWVGVCVNGGAPVNSFDLTLVKNNSVENPLETSDYLSLLSEVDDCGHVTVSMGIGGTWLFIPLTAAGLSQLNPVGITRFGLRSSRDIAGTDPAANIEEWISLYGKGTNYEPILILRME